MLIQSSFMVRLMGMVLLVALMPAFAQQSPFAGSSECAQCHQSEFDAWQGSHHQLAMGIATEQSVLGDFNDAVLNADGVQTRFFRRDGKFMVATGNAAGETSEFEVAYTFGVQPLQQYLVRFPDGRVQALRQSWDTRPVSKGGQRWFHQYPGMTIDANDELHWTGPQQNWNYMCADCHSTNVDKGYDPELDHFDTTWSEISVGCEACHGPARAHVDWARMPPERQSALPDKGLSVRLNDRQGVSWPIDPDTGIAQRQGPAHTGTELQVCASCHARRGTLKPGVAENPVFLDHHMPAFLTESLYHRDGQIKDEVFVWGSYIQSKMHAAGVTCSNCHDPHSMDLHAPQEQVCAQCHSPAVFATTAHHKHPVDSSGANCLGCHMPETTYMVVDPRRDHSLRSPRPDLSQQYGTPNACSGCHQDQDLAWAVDAFTTMFPDPSRPFQSWTNAFKQAREGQPQAEVSLVRVISDQDVPDIARATAMLELAPFLSPLSGQVLEHRLIDPSPLVRIAALRTLEAIPPANRYSLAAQLLTDPLLAVRVEAARVLAQTPLEQMDLQQRGALQMALKDYFDAQQYNADRPESRMNLGNMQAQAGNARQAENYYRQAISRNPRFGPAYVNLSDLYRDQGMQADALNILQQGLERVPADPALLHSLGLAQFRTQNTQAAVESLRQAAEAAPDSPRYVYVYGVALNSTQQTEKALEVLKSAQERFPYNRDILMALATMERDQGRYAQATKWAENLLTLNPADTVATQLLQQLQQLSEGTREP